MRLRSRASWFCAVALVASAQGLAANPPPPPPDEDFLAFLGAWGGDEEDWQVVQDAMGHEPARAARPAKTEEQARRTAADGATTTARERTR